MRYLQVWCVCWVRLLKDCLEQILKDQALDKDSHYYSPRHFAILTKTTAYTLTITTNDPTKFS